MRTSPVPRPATGWVAFAALVLGGSACQLFLGLNDETRASADAATDVGSGDGGGSGDVGAPLSEAGSDASVPDAAAPEAGVFLCQPPIDGGPPVYCQLGTQQCCYVSAAAPNYCAPKGACGSAEYSIDCTSDAHCTAGRVCCYSELPTLLECKAVCNAPALHVCVDEGECGGGQCQRKTALYKVCL